MRHVSILLSYFFASLMVSATQPPKEPSKGKQNVVANDLVSVRPSSRVGSRGSSSTRGSGAGASSSSTLQKQRSPPIRPDNQRGTSSSTQSVPYTARSRSPSPVFWTASWRETSPVRQSSTTRSRSPSPDWPAGWEGTLIPGQSISPPTRSRSPSPIRRNDWGGGSLTAQHIPTTTRSRSLSVIAQPPLTSRSRSLSPSHFNMLGRQRPRAGNPLAMANGPIRLQGGQIQRSGTITRSRSGTDVRLDAPAPQGIISGHPNSAMVVVKGPGYMQAQTSDGVLEFAHVHPGKYDYIAVHDPNGGFALGRTTAGGHAIAASTGNAAAGYAAVHHTATGFVKTHNNDIETFHQVTPGEEYRKHVRGDNTRSVKGAALAEVEGHGQVTAVAMSREVNQDTVLV